MPNLKEVRLRIESVKSTQQITSAMKMVSASKFRKAQTAVWKLRPYADKLKIILGNLTYSLGSGEGVYSEAREVNRVLLVVITSNKGLCGGFNSGVLKKTQKLLDEKYHGLCIHKQLDIITIGKKATEYFKKKNIGILESYDSVYEVLDFEHVVPIAEQLMGYYARKKYDQIELIYNHMKNAATQEVMHQQYLPVEPPTEALQAEKTSEADYIFEPNKQVIVEGLIPKSLKIQLYKALLDSFAGEHGARMTAMHKATDNAGDMLKELKLTYNKARQAAITGEILEIVGGAEALKG